MALLTPIAKNGKMECVWSVPKDFTLILTMCAFKSILSVNHSILLIKYAHSATQVSKLSTMHVYSILKNLLLT